MELENLQHQLGNIYYIVLYECVERENGLGCHNETQLLFLIKLQQIKQRDIEKKKGEEAHCEYCKKSTTMANCLMEHVEMFIGCIHRC